MSGDGFVTFTAGTNIFFALMHGPEVRDVFRKLGLKCVASRERGLATDYCVAAERETLAETALYHETDLQELLTALNALKVRPLTPAEEEGGGR